jgi:DNA topoisomerase I
LSKSKPQPPKKPKIKAPASDSDSDVPLAAKSKPKSSPSATKRPSSSPAVQKKSHVKKEDSDDDVPLARAKPAKSKPIKRAKPESDSDDDVPLAAKTKKPKHKVPTNGSTKSTPTKKKRVKADENLDVNPEEDDEEYRWWEDAQHDGTKKWNTLEHNGVLFPPPYEPLPKNIKMKYNGTEVTLPPEAEEVAGFFAALIESDHGQNPVFQENFFNDWMEVLKELKVVLPSN